MKIALYFRLLYFKSYAIDNILMDRLDVLGEILWQ
jgi:hypothetical protein